MEALLKNLSSSVELLAVAGHSSVVEQWDQHTVSRAFHWARYCEHLHSRFHHNPTVRRIMEKQLHITNQSLRSAFPGCTEVTFADLSQCRHLLLQSLLNNVKLPVSIIKTLFDHRCPVNAENSDQDVSGLCSSVIRCKSACKVLRPLTDSSALRADAEVLGAALMQTLDTMTGQSGDVKSRMEHFLDSVLQGREGARQHLCTVITAALLRCNESAAETAACAVLLDWLLKKHSLLKQVVSAMPTAVAVDLAKKHQKFKDMYRTVLKEWASDMEYNLSEGEWTAQTSTHPSVSFQKLTQHFLALFEACPSQRDDVENEFTVLKISDGDYDVRGLSVWGDLLSAFNT